MPFACLPALLRCVNDVASLLSRSPSHQQQKRQTRQSVAADAVAVVDGRYPGAGLIYVVCAGRERTRRRRGRACKQERESARQVFSSSPMCSLLLQREIERTAWHMLLYTHTHTFTLNFLVLSHSLPLSRTHTMHAAAAAANSPEHICFCCFELDWDVKKQTRRARELQRGRRRWADLKIKITTPQNQLQLLQRGLPCLSSLLLL